jgi:hypothetical protein
MVSALFTAFAMIAAGQLEPSAFEVSGAKARAEWLAELEAEFQTSTTALIEGRAREPETR